MSRVSDILDEFHYHEMLDRLHVVMSTCDDHLIQHPVAKLHTDVKQNIDKAIEYLWAAYQLTGQISINKFDNEQTTSEDSVENPQG